MSAIHVDAPRRKRWSFAIFWRKLWSQTGQAKAPHIKISDHLARDIGLSPADLERLRYEPPSSCIRHPQL